MSEFSVELTPEAREDIVRLYEFWLSIDIEVAERVIHVIESAWDSLRKHPYICRKADDGSAGPLWREFLIDFGNSGYVALFEIQEGNIVKVSAVRHQRESDYH